MLGTHGCVSDQNPQFAWAVSVAVSASGPRSLETEEPVSPLPLPLPAQGRPCNDRLLVVEEKAEEGGVTWPVFCDLVTCGFPFSA